MEASSIAHSKFVIIQSMRMINESKAMERDEEIKKGIPQFDESNDKYNQ